MSYDVDFIECVGVIRDTKLDKNGKFKGVGKTRRVLFLATNKRYESILLFSLKKDKKKWRNRKFSFAEIYELLEFEKEVEKEMELKEELLPFIYDLILEKELKSEIDTMSARYVGKGVVDYVKKQGKHDDSDNILFLTREQEERFIKEGKE